jgi:hypothetical protein
LVNGIACGRRVAVAGEECAVDRMRRIVSADCRASELGALRAQKGAQQRQSLL